MEVMVHPSFFPCRGTRGTDRLAFYTLETLPSVTLIFTMLIQAIERATDEIKTAISSKIPLQHHAQRTHAEMG
jgi:hypothetical protein